MYTMDAVQTLNDQGIRLLEIGKPSDAIEFFQLAIQMFDEGFIVSSSDTSLCQRDACPCPITQINTSKKLMNLCEESMYVFDRAIMFTSEKVGSNCNNRLHGAGAAPNDDGFILCNMILLFNLALAHQQKGKISGRVTDFQNASTIYILMLHRILLTGKQDESLRFLTLLALNNRAQVHHEYLFDYEVSQSFLQTMSDILVSHGPVHGLTSNDYKCLLQNALFARIPSVACAA
jgi:hypothetical protein